MALSILNKMIITFIFLMAVGVLFLDTLKD